MWIVRYAIAHRHTVGVLAILLLLFGRDFGDRVEIVAGLETADRVILSPNALLREGDKIAVTMATVLKATDQKTR